ncbi:MAG: hypothetical protein K2K64_07740 [Muribaculaceae bacterium]|nr:hypothetical protein [Muribaculaceae bacterium]MDE7109019.1 hypothetical protein [Muribaculaceae bacterium]
MHTPHIYIPIPPPEEQSTVTVTCPPADYSASRIAHAVEDADAHLLALSIHSAPSPLSDKSDLSDPSDLSALSDLTITLRISHTDPTAVTRSLERYGYEVISTSSPSHNDTITTIAIDRLQSLNALLNV